MVTYTLLKNSEDNCGDSTDFRLKIVPSAGYSFHSMTIDSMSGLYVTAVTVNLVQDSNGGTEIKHLCNAPVVCAPESVEIEITTKVPNMPDKKETKDYKGATNS